MSAYGDLMFMANSYRLRAARIPEEASRLKYDPAPAIAELTEKAELYEATAADVRDLPDHQAREVARRFRVAMWARDEAPEYEPDDYHP